jgi:hypothetical protein
MGDREDGGGASYEEHFCESNGCCSLPEFGVAFCVSHGDCDSECAQRVGLLSCSQCDQEYSASGRFISAECRISTPTIVAFFTVAALAHVAACCGSETASAVSSTAIVVNFRPQWTGFSFARPRCWFCLR